MKLERTIYNIAIRFAYEAARLAAPMSGKISKGISGRKNLRSRWLEGAKRFRRSGKIVWFHVSSVGEYEQAKPVMALLSDTLGPDLELALTFFSPSGMSFYERFDRSRRIEAISFVEYLPLDTKENAKFCLDTLRPDLIVYVKFDLWPNLILEAAGRGIPQVLISGTLSPGSWRLSRAARNFYGHLYSKLSLIAAISEEDAERFRNSSGGLAKVVEVGDTRFDQVCRRIDSAKARLPKALEATGRSWIIAGSTWPKDEKIIISGYRAVRRAHLNAGLVIVPHEPSRERLSSIEKTLSAAGLAYRFFSSIEDAPFEEDVVVVDGVGILAELYRAGKIAYVGGSFSTGVHNVLEPAVLRLPVLFGPRIENSWEAKRLVQLDIATIVRSGEEVARAVASLLSNESLRKHKGARAEEFVRSHCGAAFRCVDFIERILRNKG